MKEINETLKIIAIGIFVIAVLQYANCMTKISGCINERGSYTKPVHVYQVK